MESTDIKNFVNEAICCIVNTSAGYTDEQVTSLRVDLEKQIASISNIDPSILDGLRALVDPDPNTPEWDARENVFVTLGKISEQFKVVDGKIVNLETSVKTVSEVIVKEISRLETRIKSVETKVEGFDNRIAANETSSAENSAAIKINAGRIDQIRTDVDGNAKYILSLMEALQGVCEVSAQCLEDYKSSKGSGTKEPEIQFEGDSDGMTL